MKTLQAEYEEMMPEIKVLSTKDNITAKGFSKNDQPAFSQSGMFASLPGVSGIKFCFKASDLVQLQINDCRRIKIENRHRKWVLV